MEEATEAIEFEGHEMQAFAGVEPRLNLNLHHQSQGSFLSNFSVTSCVISYTRFARFFLFLFMFITCVPLIAGAAFTSIFIEDKNYNAAVGAFFTAIMSLGTLSLFVLHLLRKIEKYHDTKTLEGVKVFAMLGSVASGISIGVYTIFAFFKKQAFEFQGLNFFSSAVFSGLCLVTSIQLYLTAQWYQNALQASTTSSQQSAAMPRRP